MNLTISGHHLELTPAIRSHVENKVARFSKYFDHIIGAHAILTVDKQLVDKDKRHKVEITLQLKGKDAHATGLSHDMYLAIDDAVEKLERQLGKYKERVQDHKAEKPGLLGNADEDTESDEELVA